jgi:replicative DNA helicase
LEQNDEHEHEGTPPVGDGADLGAAGERPEPLPDHGDAFAGSGFDSSRWAEGDATPPEPDGWDSEEGWDPAPASADLEPEAADDVPEAAVAAADLHGDDLAPDASGAPEPAATEPAATEPAATEPAAAEPTATEPAAAEPEPEAVADGAAGAAAPLPPAAPGPPGEELPSFELPREAAPQGAPTRGASGGRVVPHDLGAERSVLGALMMSPDRLVEVSEICRPSDFFERRHRLLYETMIELDARGQVVDGVTLTSTLRATKRLGEVGGISYLGDVASSVSTSAHVKHHASLVSETAKLRGLIEASNTIVSRAMETPPDPDEVQTLIDESESAIFSVAASGETRGAAGVSSILDEVFHGLEAQRDRGEFTGIPSGFYDLDEMLGGFNPGEMTVIAARPAMGKTAFVLNLMDHASTHVADCLGYAPSVLFFSLEMGRASIVQRMLVARAQVEAHRLRSGRLQDREYADLVEAAGVLKGARLFIDDTPGLSIMALRSRARRLKAEHGLDMIVIDYLQLLSAKAESRQQEISTISRALKELARELEIPLITLAQLSRSVESREEKRPQLSDLRESGSIEQDADVVAMLYRPEYYFPIDENKGKAEVLIVKHRNGATGTVELQFQGAMLRFSNREPSMAEPITGL